MKKRILTLDKELLTTCNPGPIDGGTRGSGLNVSCILVSWVITKMLDLSVDLVTDTLGGGGGGNDSNTCPPETVYDCPTYPVTACMGPQGYGNLCDGTA